MKLKRRLDKKGTAQDVLFLAAAGFFFLFLFFVILAFIFYQVNNALLNVPLISGNSEAVDVLSSGGSFINNLDKVAVGFFFGSLLGLIVTSWFVAGNPLGMLAYFFLGVGAIIVSMFVSNIWGEIMSKGVFDVTVQLFPFANHVMNTLPFYIGIFWFVGIVITFAKPQLFQNNDSFVGGGLP